MTSTLDESLLDRAHAVRRAATLIRFPTGSEIPAWALGATDVRIALVAGGRADHQPDRVPGFPKLGDPEFAVARGQAESSIRTISEGGTDYRVVAVPYATTARRWCSPSRWPPRSTCSNGSAR